MLSTVGLIIDVVIIAAVVISAIIGYKKGFLKSILSLFSWVVCIIVAVLTAKYVANWINGIFNFSGLIGEKIAEGLSNSNEFFTKTINSFASKEDIINGANSIDINGLLKQVVKIVFSNNNVDMQSAETLGCMVGSSLGHIIMIIISAILVFIVLKIAVALLSKLFDNIARTKILGGLNKILGLVLGAIKAACIVFIINCAIVGLSLIPAVNNFTTPFIQQNTHVEKFIYNTTDNLVEKYIIEGNVIQEWVNNLWDARN